MSKEKEPNPTSAIELFYYMAKRPHDAAFKLLMKNKDISTPYLHAQLPLSLSSRCHWDQMEFIPTEFLDSQFKDQRCDLLLKLPYGKKEHCYIHLLFESQRTHDRTMPWRLLKYMVSIWQDIEQKRTVLYEKQKKDGLSSKQRISIFPLPSIFPIVFYNGKEKWTTSTSFIKSKLIEIPHRFCCDFIVTI